MEDIAPALLEKILADFKAGTGDSEAVKKFHELAAAGTADYEAANAAAQEIGEALAEAFRENLSSDVLPDGKMYYNIAKRVVGIPMTEDYEEVAEIAETAQTCLNQSADIGIKAVRPQLNQDRIDGIVNRISSADSFDDVSWILDAPIREFSQSIIDDAVKANVEFHANSGLQPKIVRKMAGKCCEWCAKIAGTYKYPDVPKDVYRRHDNCRCQVLYYPTKGKMETVHSGTEGKRTYVQDKYGNYVKSKDVRKEHARQMAATEEERKEAARQKRIATWKKKKQQAEMEKTAITETRKTISISGNRKMISGNMEDVTSEYIKKAIRYKK